MEAPGVESAGNDSEGLADAQPRPNSADHGESETPNHAPESSRTSADVAPGQNRDDIPKALPAPPMTVADVLRAADRAVVVGDVHGARRLVAEALARCGVTDWEATDRAHCFGEGGDRG